MLIVLHALNYNLLVFRHTTCTETERNKYCKQTTGFEISTSGWLFKSITWGLPRNYSSLVVRAGLDTTTFGLQVRRSNHSATRCLQKEARNLNMEVSL